jgi:hypothetical protein
VLNTHELTQVERIESAGVPEKHTILKEEKHLKNKMILLGFGRV